MLLQRRGQEVRVLVLRLQGVYMENMGECSVVEILRFGRHFHTHQRRRTRWQVDDVDIEKAVAALTRMCSGRRRRARTCTVVRLHKDARQLFGCVDSRPRMDDVRTQR